MFYEMKRISKRNKQRKKETIIQPRENLKKKNNHQEKLCFCPLY
jgi:hypothetical protein